MRAVEKEETKMSEDTLRVQVSLTIKTPEGVRVSKKVLEQILGLLIDHKPLPNTVTVRAIAWQNPERRGKMKLWRWAGDDPTGLTGDRESSPSGSLRSAIDTLAPFLETGQVTF